MGLKGIVDIPSSLKMLQMWAQIPSCMRAYFGDNIIWGALDDTLQPCPTWVREYPMMYGKYWNGRKQYNEYVYNQVLIFDIFGVSIIS